MSNTAKLIAAFRTLIDSPSVEVRTYQNTHEKWGTEEISDEHLRALIESDGEEVPIGDGSFYSPLEIQLCNHGDYYGSDIDAANMRHLGEVFGDLVTHHEWSERYLWFVFGELPIGMDVEEYAEQLTALSEMMSGLWEYPLLSDEAHSDYVHDLVQEKWDSSFNPLAEEVEDDIKERAFDASGRTPDLSERREEVTELYMREAWWIVEGYDQPINENHSISLAETIKGLGLIPRAHAAHHFGVNVHRTMSGTYWFETLPGLWSLWPTVEGNTSREYFSKWELRV